MKYWYDTEFIEDGQTIDLLSIGIVSEDGRELYLESSQANWSKASDWVKKNVLPRLLSYRAVEGGFTQSACDAVSRGTIALMVREFCDPDKYGRPEFWAYYADYDHVALCQLFGTMMDLPEGWPRYTNDIKQLCNYLGDRPLPKQGKDEHNALDDAYWNREAYEYLLREPQAA